MRTCARSVAGWFCRSCGAYLPLSETPPGLLYETGARTEKEIAVSCISAHDPQLVRLADAIAQRVGPQRFNVWFNNSTKLDLKQDGLEISVPNDFISEWIGTHYTRPIQEAAAEVLGTQLAVRFCVVPQLFVVEVEGAEKEGKHNGNGTAQKNGAPKNGHAKATPIAARKAVEMIRPAVRPTLAPSLPVRAVIELDREKGDNS